MAGNTSSTAGDNAQQLKSATINASEKSSSDHSNPARNMTPPQTELAKGFRSRYQLRRMIFENAIKWFFGVVLLLFIFATLKLYQNKGNTAASNKQWFNVIMTGLNIALGINFFSALGDLAKILRWRVLAETPHSMRDIDLILSADSLAKLTALAFRYYRLALMKIVRGKKGQSSGGKALSSRSSASFIWSASKISLWLGLNLVAQAVIALIGLTYGYDAGYPVVPAPMGPTFQTDLSHFYSLNFGGRPPNNVASEQLAAHQLGDIGTIFSDNWVNGRRDPKTYQNSEEYYYIPDPKWSKDYKDSGVGLSWIYRYFNYDAPYFWEYQYSVPTSRTINATWDVCYQYPVLDGAGIAQSNATVTYQLPHGQNRTILVDIVGKAATTYIYPGPEFSHCVYYPSPRCSAVMAFQEPFKDFAPHVYYCEITVGHVIDDDDSKQVDDIPDTQARYAAAAIGLSGFGTTESVFTKTNKTTGQQFQRYAHDSWWNLAKNASAEYAGSMIAQFAISSLAAMGELNPKHPTYGPSIKLGVQLSVEWWALRILLPVIAFAHFVLFFFAVFLANPYVVRDDSNLANAQLFAPMLQRAGLGLGGSGSYLTGKEIAKLCDDGLGQREVLYGVKPSDTPPNLAGERERQGSTFWLGLAEDHMKRRHSDGVYL